MKRGLSVSLLVACALAGALAAYAFAGGPVPLADTTTTGTMATTTSATTTLGTTTSITTATTTTTTTTTTRTVPAPRLLPEGVTIGGVPVGNLLPAEAARALRAYFSRPLKLRLGKHVYTADPNALATAKITKAVGRAKKARPFANLGLAVVVKTVKVRSFVASLAREVEKTPIDSRLILRNLKPFLTRERPGFALVQPASVDAIVKALRLNERVVKLPTKKTHAAVTRKSFGPVIVIHRGSNRLYLYHGAKMSRIFPVATGQNVYPTPLGSFQIVVMWRNPWWYPPNSAWAKGEQPVPPGPNNPLGTRWMGISSPGVGIHGTNNDASIGYSVSHGCIRMHVRDAEWLFNHVVIGTPVFIVSA
jgi:lipoprotein-anchoring transpeptidase ErfK/SrfK